MKKALIIIFGILLISVNAIETVMELNLEAYLGDWYLTKFIHINLGLKQHLHQPFGICYKKIASVKSQHTLLERGTLSKSPTVGEKDQILVK